LQQTNGESGRRASPAGWTPVYEGLKDAIVSHRLTPATKLPEDELAAIYAVSRTIVRAALQALAHDRLVQLEPNRGAFVASPTPREAREVFEARAVLEPHVAGLAAQVATPDDIASLHACIAAEEQTLAADRASDAIVQSAEFHVRIAEIANQSILTSYVRDLVARSSLIIALYWKRRDTTCESHAHRALVKAIADHSEKDAAELMTSHLVDLVSGLDLRQAPSEPKRLSDILAS
jgi:DNA-binding GntR family transcriptional regulator